MTLHDGRTAYAKRGFRNDPSLPLMGHLGPSAIYAFAAIRGKADIDMLDPSVRTYEYTL